MSATSGRSRGRLPRYLDGPDLAEAFLAAAVAAVLAIRAFLAATGYPQVGGSTLHIAHMLWGGLLMLTALLMLLGSRVRVAAALIGGLGFGTFIDELGKFLTHDNNYFFRPAIALIYAVFVIVFLIVRAIPRHRPPSPAERLGYAYLALTDLTIGRLTRRRRRKALALLSDLDAQCHDSNQQLAAIHALLARADAPPRADRTAGAPGNLNAGPADFNADCGHTPAPAGGHHAAG